MINDTSRKVNNIMYNIKKNQNYEQFEELFKDMYDRNTLEQIRYKLRDYKELPVENDLKKIHDRAASFVESVSIMNNNLSNIKEELKTLSKKVNNKEDLHRAYYLMNLLKNYKEIYDGHTRTLNSLYISSSNNFAKIIYKGNNIIDEAQRYVDEIYKEGGTDAIYEVLKPYSAAIDAKYEEILEHYKKVDAPEWVVENKKAEYERLKITKEKVRNLLSGREADAHALNSFLEGYMNNQDPVVFGLALYVKNAYTDLMNTTYAKTQAFADKIKEKLKKINYSPNDPRVLTEKITAIEYIASHDGNITDEEFQKVAVRSYLNPWINWQGKLGEVNYKLNKARESGNENDINEAYKEREELLKNFYNEYTDEYYQIMNSLRVDEIGEKAYEKLSELDKEIRDIQKNKGMNGFLEDETLNELKLLLRKRKSLFSLYDDFGIKKDVNSEEYKIAERLQKNSKLKQDLYDITPNEKLFQNTFTEFLEGLNGQGIKEGTAEWQGLVNKWISQNTIVKPKDSFYLERSAIYQKLEQLKQEYKALTGVGIEKDEEYVSLQDELNKIIYKYRDKNGHPEASLIPPELRSRVKELHDELEYLANSSKTMNGLTKEENEWLRDYFSKLSMIKSGSKKYKITSEDRDRAQSLQAKKVSFSKKEIAGKPQKEQSKLLKAQLIKFKIKALYDQLNSMQENVYSEDYVSDFANWLTVIEQAVIHNVLYPTESDKKLKSYVAEIKRYFEALDIKQYTSDDIKLLFTDNEDIMIKLLTISNSYDLGFTEWFNENHFARKMFKNFDYETVYLPTKIWYYISPIEESHKEKFTLKTLSGKSFEGYGVIDSKYNSWDIKSKYKTEKITIQDAIKMGDITKATFSEHENTWLPKLNPNSEFYNKAYFDLQNSDPDYFAVLQDILEYHISNQEGQDTKDQLGFQMARYRAKRFEKVKYRGDEIDQETGELKSNKSRLSRLWEDVVSFFKQRPDDVERGFNPDESHFATPSVLFDEYDDKIIVTGKYDIGLDEVSMDTFESLTKYMSSLERKKTVRGLNPVARAIQQTVNNPDNTLKMLKKTAKDQALARKITFIKTDKTVRSEAINNFIEREFESVYQKGFGSDSQAFQSVAAAVQKLSAVNMFALNFNSALKNSLGAKVQGLIESVSGRYFNMSDYGKGIVWANRAMFDRSYTLYQTGSRSELVQIMQLFDMTTGRTEEVLGDQMTRTPLTDLVNSPTGVLTNFRKWGEQNSEVSVAAAVLYNTKVPIIVGNQTTYIPYIEAWEKNKETGLIQLKEGIDPKWGLNGEMFKIIKNRVAAVTNDTNGAFAKFDSPEADRYVAYRALMFLRRWFTRMFINRFGASNLSLKNILSPAGWANLQERHDVGKNDTQMGWYMRSLRSMSIIFQSGMKGFELMTPEDKQAFLRIAMDIVTMLLATFIIVFILGFDPDDPDKYEKLRKRSGALPTPFTSESEYDFQLGGYLANHSILLLMGMRQEQLQWIPLPGFGLDDYKEYLQLQPIALSNTLNTGVKFLNALTNAVLGRETARYQRSVGPYKWQEQESLKMFNYAAKSFGFTGTQTDPVLAIRNFVSIQARKGN